MATGTMEKANGEVGKELLTADVGNREKVVSLLRRYHDRLRGKAQYVAATLESHRDVEDEALDAAHDVQREIETELAQVIRTAEAALGAVVDQGGSDAEPAWKRGRFAVRLQECATTLRQCDMRLCAPEVSLEEYDDSEANATGREIVAVRALVQETREELDRLVRCCSVDADAQRRNLLGLFDRLGAAEKADVVRALEEKSWAPKPEASATTIVAPRLEPSKGDDAQADDDDSAEPESPIAERLWRALPKLRGLEPSPEDASKVFPDPELPSLPTIYVGMLGAISDLSEAVAVAMHYFGQYGPPEDEPLWEADHARAEDALQSAAGGVLALQELTALLAGTRFRQRLFEFSGTELAQLRTAGAALGNWDQVRAPIVHALNKLIGDPEGAHDAWWMYLRGKDDPAVAKVMKAGERRRAAAREAAPALAGAEST